MGSIKLNISMDEKAVETLRRRAAEAGKPMGRFLAELVEDDERRARDALAEEGYRVLAADTQAFAEAAWPLVQELPWVWDEGSADTRAEPASEGEERDGSAETPAR